VPELPERTELWAARAVIDAARHFLDQRIPGTSTFPQSAVDSLHVAVRTFDLVTAVDEG
jgi:hypothetical protein